MFVKKTCDIDTDNLQNPPKLVSFDGENGGVGLATPSFAALQGHPGGASGICGTSDCPLPSQASSCFSEEFGRIV